MPETLHMHCSSIYNGLKDGIRLCLMNYTLSSEVRHFHDFYELVFVTAGEGTHSTEYDRRKIMRGSVFLIRPGEAHSYFDLNGLSIINVLYLPEKLLLPLAGLRSLNGFVFFFESAREGADNSIVIQLSEEKIRQAEVLLNEMCEEQNRSESGYAIALNALLWKLFLLISRVAGRENGELPVELTQLYCYCNSHLHSVLQVQDIADHFHLSARSLERLLQRTLGKTPARFLQNLKLTHAANLLSTSNRKIAKIAEDSGFADAGYFTRLFRKCYGLSPMQYRKQQTSAPKIPVTDK